MSAPSAQLLIEGDRGMVNSFLVTAAALEDSERKGAMKIHSGTRVGGRGQGEAMEEDRSRSELLRTERRGASQFPAGRKRGLQIVERACF